MIFVTGGLRRRLCPRRIFPLVNRSANQTAQPATQRSRDQCFEERTRGSVHLFRRRLPRRRSTPPHPRELAFRHCWGLKAFSRTSGHTSGMGGALFKGGLAQAVADAALVADGSKPMCSTIDQGGRR